MRFKPEVSLLFAIIFLFALAFALPRDVRAQYDDGTLKLVTNQNILRDSTAGEDLEIRQSAVQALGGRAGTVVVMNSRTGRIYSIVNQAWALRRGFKPCSTIKLVTGIAGYNESLINPNGAVSNIPYRLGLNDALAHSDNTFFQKVGSGLGLDNMLRYAVMLGLGSPTGINMPDEYGGRLPNGNSNSRIYSHGDDFEVTPLQLAVLVSSITNGGEVLIPQVPESRIAKTSFRGYYHKRLEMRSSVYERMIPGMVGAVTYGTAKGAAFDAMQIAGKTGSCTANGTWVGLFASVAPIHDPRFSVIVILEGKNARGKYAAIIAGKVYRSLVGRANEKYSRPVARKLSPSTQPDVIRLGSAQHAKTQDSAPKSVPNAEYSEQTTNYGDATVTVTSSIPGSDRRSSRTKITPRVISTRAITNDDPMPSKTNVQKNGDKLPIFTRPRIVGN